MKKKSIAALVLMLSLTTQAHADWAVIQPPLVHPNKEGPVLINTDVPKEQWEVQGIFPDKKGCEHRRKMMADSVLTHSAFDETGNTKIPLEDVRVFKLWMATTACVEVK
jgi:hypothetical protein